ERPARRPDRAAGRAAGEASRPRAAECAARRAQDADAAGPGDAAAGRRAPGGGGGRAAVPRLRQSRCAQPLRHLPRPAAGPWADLRCRGRLRALGAGTGACASRPLPRAWRHALGARRRRAGGSRGAAVAGPHRRGRAEGGGGDPRPARHRRWRDDGALPLRPPGGQRHPHHPPGAGRADGRSTRCARRGHAGSGIEGAAIIV
ncbi:MAG: RecR, partial [uncultured Craurococcus sp.]